MNNVLEYEDKIAVHPGYYIKEIIDESGLTQEDFAKRMGTTPKNLSILVRGEQSLSIDMATKLSRMLGTTVEYWLALQQSYDEMAAEYLSLQELKKEREVFKLIDYRYFRDNFGLPDHSRNIDEQIKAVREFLAVSSLTVLEERNLSVNFRSDIKNLTRSNIINSNIMAQIAINNALKIDTAKYNKKEFQKQILLILTQTESGNEGVSLIKQAFKKAGVVLVVVPELKDSGIKGATKKLDGKIMIMIMISGRKQYADTFWFTLFHEIGHVFNGDLGLTFNDEKEDEADLYVRNSLIPKEKYKNFLATYRTFDEKTIRSFAADIKRDPGIVLGRLIKDGLVSNADKKMIKALRREIEL